MKIFPHAEFRVDLPDDALEGGDDVIMLPGRGLAEIVAEMLTQLGYEVSPPEHDPEHGWTFDAYAVKRRIWLQVTQIPGKTARSPAKGTLMTEEKPTLLRRLLGHKDSIHAKLLFGLNREMQADPRFKEIRWWPDFHFRGVWSDAPVVAGI